MKIDGWQSRVSHVNEFIRQTCLASTPQSSKSPKIAPPPPLSSSPSSPPTTAHPPCPHSPLQSGKSTKLQEQIHDFKLLHNLYFKNCIFMSKARVEITSKCFLKAPSENI